MKVGLVTQALTTSGGTSRTIVELAKYYTQQGLDVTLYAYEYAPDRCFPEYLKEFKVVALRESNPSEAPSFAAWKARGYSPARLPLAALVRSYTRFLTRDPERAVAMFRANTYHRNVIGLRKLSGLFDSWVDSIVRLGDIVVDARNLAERIDKDTEFLNGIDNNVAEVLYLFRKFHGRRAALVWTCLDLPDWMELGKDAPASRSGRRWLHPRVAWRNWPLLVMHERVVRAMDRVIVHVSKNASLVRRVYGRRSDVIFPGVDVDAFGFHSPDERAQRPFLISSVAVLYPWRRFEDLLEALALLRGRHNVRLELAGSTEFSPAYHDGLLTLTRELGLEPYVTWRGRLSEAELADLYHRSNAYAWVNHNQSWGSSVFEAMACGTPVIVSRTAGASEVLTHGCDALLVPPLDPGAVSHAVDRLITEPELARRLADEARRTIASLTWDHHCERNFAIVREFSAQKRPQR